MHFCYVTRFSSKPPRHSIPASLLQPGAINIAYIARSFRPTLVHSQVYLKEVQALTGAPHKVIPKKSRKVVHHVKKRPTLGNFIR